jgi:Right handed beta helix region
MSDNANRIDSATNFATASFCRTLLKLAAPLLLCYAASASTDPPAVSVSISPTYAVVQLGQLQQFTATVTGTGNTMVTWQVDNADGGDPTTGTVSTSGLFTAPSVMPTPATATITAVSQADPTKSATAVVTLVTQPASGTAYYVSISGSDSNPGTFSKPWKTIQHAADSVHPGDTVYVRGGVYNKLVSIKVSGSASAGFITFSGYPGELAIVDGTSLKIPGGQWGLFTIESQSYVVIQGFEIRNYRTNKTADTPIGIWVFGSGSNVQIFNNHIHDIVTTAPTNPRLCTSNAFGLTVDGSKAPDSIFGLAIMGNEVDHLKTGCSESLSVDGNVDHFSITNNLVHDNDNIGIDAIGFEGVSRDPRYDQARDGEIRGNTVYNITSYGNPDYGKQYAANGIYVDGGTRIIIEQNLIHNVDLGVEVASEHPHHVASQVTVRNNVIYSDNSNGISIGGSDPVMNGGTDHCVIVNNTLFRDGTKGINNNSGEFQIQNHATSNIFENNIVYANTEEQFLNSFAAVPLHPAVVDFNLYYSTAGASNGNWTWQGKNYTGYDYYRKKTKLDHDSPEFLDPQFLSLGSPLNLDIRPTSPAVGAGTNLGSDVVGAVDFAGNPRVQNGAINIGAYEQ